MQEKMKELTAFLNYHAHRYYVLDAPEISDYEYDMALRELQKLEEAYPQFKDPASPTTRVVGQVLEGFTERMPGARKRVASVLEIMYNAHSASVFRKRAEMMLGQINNQ